MAPSALDFRSNAHDELLPVLALNPSAGDLGEDVPRCGGTACVPNPHEQNSPNECAGLGQEGTAPGGSAATRITLGVFEGAEHPVAVHAQFPAMALDQRGEGRLVAGLRSGEHSFVRSSHSPTIDGAAMSSGAN